MSRKKKKNDTIIHEQRSTRSSIILDDRFIEKISSPAAKFHFLPNLFARIKSMESREGEKEEEERKKKRARTQNTFGTIPSRGRFQPRDTSDPIIMRHLSG